MIIFPAIDLKQGRCVRLEQGDMARATLFNDNPANQAQQFVDQDFTYLHLVDLDGAFAGMPENMQAVESILQVTKAAKVSVQLGGGIRDLQKIEMWLEKGISRIILGTVAVRDPDLVKQACALFPGRVAVGIDARKGKVAVAGWAEESHLEVIALARQFEDVGVSAVIYTDIDRDGVFKGINIAATQALAEAISMPVIASGGLAGLADVQALQEHEAAGIVGVIAGRALYDGRLKAQDVLALKGVC